MKGKPIDIKTRMSAPIDIKTRMDALSPEARALVDSPFIRCIAAGVQNAGDVLRVETDAKLAARDARIDALERRLAALEERLS